jgi:hypothetical protein
MDAIESAVAITAALVTPLASEPSPAAMAEAAKPSSSSRAKLCFVDLRGDSKTKPSSAEGTKPQSSSTGGARPLSYLRAVKGINSWAADTLRSSLSEPGSSTSTLQLNSKDWPALPKKDRTAEHGTCMASSAVQQSMPAPTTPTTEPFQPRSPAQDSEAWLGLQFASPALSTTQSSSFWEAYPDSSEALSEAPSSNHAPQRPNVILPRVDL